MPQLTKTLADELTKIAYSQFEAGVKAKRSRMIDIRKNEEFYYGRKRKVMRGRFAIPLPFASGFVRALWSKIDDAPMIQYLHREIADFKKAKKVTAQWKADSGPDIGRWAQKDRIGKKLAIFSGRAIYTIFAESYPRYKSILKVVDHEDFVCEASGGFDLEEHKGLGHTHIFKTETDLQTGIEHGIYNKKQVASLIANTSDKDFAKNRKDLDELKQRYDKLGIDLEAMTQYGDRIFNLTQWVMEHKGKRYYLLFDPNTETWIRAQELQEVFKSGLWPYGSWATDEDPYNFWSKAPMDDVRPIADAMDVLFNQALENREKINFGQRAIDPDIFPDITELPWQPDGLVITKAGTSSKGRGISGGVYEFKTEKIEGTIDMLNFMDIFTGQKTGIGPATPGAPDESVPVGIYFGNIQQMADMLGLYNKAYVQCWVDLGVRYWNGLKEHMTEEQMVEIIGETGAEWTRLTRKDLHPNKDFSITVTGGNAELRSNEVKQQKKEKALDRIITNPVLVGRASPDWLFAEVLAVGGYDEAEIKVAMDKQGIMNMEMMSEASQAIQDILAGEKVKLYRRATTGFMQYILDFIYDHEITQEQETKLLAYIQAHRQIAIRNAMKMAQTIGTMPTQGGEEKTPAEDLGGEEPLMNSPAGTLKRSAEISNALRGGAPAELALQ